MYLRDIKRPQSGLKHMRGKQKVSARKREQGIIITLVAVFMLGVIGAMAALSIDVVTLYTARSEAQLAADSAALAAARIIANSGATSDSTGPLVALQGAEQNQIAGSNLTAAQINVTFGGNNPTDPTVKVSIQKNDLPTFFARIWGRTQFTVAATATAEAYNPSPAATAATNTAPPVAPICVKPWLLPNIDPKGGTTTIFSPTTGAITDPALLGWTSTNTSSQLLSSGCTGTNCSGAAPKAWKYFPADTATQPPFTSPPAAYPSCPQAVNTAYEQDLGGCIQTAIACNSTAYYTTAPNNFNQDRETADAVNCLTHAKPAGGGDILNVGGATPPTLPFQFEAGTDNPIAGLNPNDVMVSDSLVTVPVFDSTSGKNPVQIIGFVQLFLNPDGQATSTTGKNNPTKYMIPTTVINMVGCGNGTGNASLGPILGNGASPVAVRLITP